MKRLSTIATVMLLTSLVMWSTAWAQAEWQVLRTIKPEHMPVDMLVSPEKGRLFVLDDLGWISVYDVDGRLKDKIQVGADVRQIKAGPNEDVLFLLSSKAGTIRIINVDFIESIDTGKSPVKGRPDAPVSIVVFSDFQ